MTEDEFDSLIPGRPLRPEDIVENAADAGRLTMLGLALWGRTLADLARRFEAPYPEIPPGCTLADLRSLERHLQRLSIAAGKPESAWLGPLLHFSWNMTAEAMEARLEILRRAIEYLEGQS